MLKALAIRCSLLTLPATFLILFAAHDDADNSNLSWSFLVVVGGFLTAAAAAVGALIAKVLPAWGQYLKDHAAADAERQKGEVALAAEKDRSATAARQVEAAIQNEREKMAATMKSEMYDRVYEEFRELLNRHEKDAARRDGHIEAQDKRISDLYMEIRGIHGQHTECLVKNERLLAEVTVLRAQAQTNRVAEAAAAIPTRTDAVIVIDARGIIREWSAPATALFNWRMSEAIGKSVEIIVPEAYREAHRAAFADVLSTGRGVRRGPYRLEGLRQDGTTFPIELTLSCWESEGARYFSANVTPLVPSVNGQQPVGSLAASEDSLLNSIRTIVERRGTHRTPEAGTPAPSVTTVNLPAVTTVEVKADSVNLGSTPAPMREDWNDGTDES